MGQGTRRNDVVAEINDLKFVEHVMRREDNRGRLE